MTAPFSRRSLLAGAGLALFSAPASASRTPRPALPRLGTSRTLAVNTAGGPCFGRKEYASTLPLADGEVVLTFDDGPLPATTPHVLDALAAEVQKRTFAALWPSIRNQFRDGVRVAFGELEAGASGLAHAGKLLRWHELKELTITQGKLSVKQTGKWLP